MSKTTLCLAVAAIALAAAGPSKKASGLQAYAIVDPGQGGCSIHSSGDGLGALAALPLAKGKPCAWFRLDGQVWIATDPDLLGRIRVCLREDPALAAEERALEAEEARLDAREEALDAESEGLDERQEALEEGGGKEAQQAVEAARKALEASMNELQRQVAALNQRQKALEQRMDIAERQAEKALEALVREAVAKGALQRLDSGRSGRKR